MEGFLPDNFTLTISEEHQHVLMFYTWLMPIICAVVIIMNLVVVVVTIPIIKNGTEPRATYLFLGNVALADLWMGSALIFGIIFPESELGLTSCSIQIGLIVSSTLISVYTVGLIAVDRFLYIRYGFKYQHLMSPTRTHVMLALTWLIGLVIGFLPLMGWYASESKDHCWFIHLAPPALILLTACAGLVPVILVITMYSMLLYVIIANHIRMRDAKTTPDGTINASSTSTAPPAKTKMPASKWKAVWIVVLTTGSFTCTWMPYLIASFMYVFCDPDSTPEWCENLTYAIASPLPILGALNSLFNPLIYAWWHVPFRRNVRKILHIKSNSREMDSKQSVNSKTGKSSQDSVTSKVNYTTA